MAEKKLAELLKAAKPVWLFMKPINLPRGYYKHCGRRIFTFPVAAEPSSTMMEATKYFFNNNNYEI